MAEPLSLILLSSLNRHRRRLEMLQSVMQRTVLVAAGLFLLVVSELGGQTSRPVALDPRKALTQYTFDLWEPGTTPLEGAIRSIVQTTDGYLWLGTQEGLYRFDGVEFTVFNSRNTQEMRNSNVSALAEDREGALWIATRDGLLRYKNDSFKRYSTKDGLSSNILLSLCVDRRGDLWIGASAGGLTRYSSGAFRSSVGPNELRSGTIWSICSAQDSSLWIGTASAGVFRLRNNEVTGYRVKQGLASDVVRSICEGSDGCIWVGTQGGVNCIRGGRLSSLKLREGLSSEVVMQLFEDSRGTLWIGTGGGGVNRYVHGQISSFTSKDRLTNDNVLSFAEDREGSLWIGTADGLGRFKDEAFTVYALAEGLSNDVVWCAYEDREGSMWLGTNGGLNRLRRGEIRAYTTRHGLSLNTVSAVCEDAQHTLWIGTYGGGVCQFKAGQVTRSPSNIPSGSFVFAIHEDREHSLWIGTSDGLYRHTRYGLNRYSTLDGLAGNFIRFIEEDRAGDVWIGTNEGLSLFSANRLTKFTTRNGLASDLLMCFNEDHEGVKWFGTDGGGLIRLKENVFTAITTRDGLPGDVVYAILEDDLGYLWLGGDRGISRVNKKELNDCADGKIGSISSMTFGRKDGLRSRECSGGSQPAGWKSKDGRLWFAMVKGVAVIDPRNLKINSVPPPVILQRLFADNQAKPVAPGCVLDAGTNRIEFRYAGLSFISPGDVTFRYTLEGYDKDWIEAGSNRTVTYTNIPPGHYTFLVRAANEDGVWNVNGASFSFTLRPYFYQTTFFAVLAVVCVLVVAAGSYSVRMRRLVRRTHELERTVAGRTTEIVFQKEALEKANRDLNALLGQLEEKSRLLDVARVRAEEANQAKSAFLANVSHELRTPLNSVIGFTSVLLKNKERNLRVQDLTYLDRILENGKHLLELIEDVLDLSRIEAGRAEIRHSVVSLHVLIHETIAQLEGKLIDKDVSLTAEVPARTQPMETDPGKLRQILINLLGNAMKFTDRGAITVRVAVEPATRRPVRIAVSDTGIGISPDLQRVIFEPFTQGDERKTRRYGGTGLGLAISRTLSDLLGYTLEVQSEEGVGSTFTIILDPGVNQFVYANQETAERDQASMNERNGVSGAARDIERETKEKILVELMPFSHGEWAHMTINRIALFGRNLRESTTPRQYARFRAPLTEYLEKIHPAISRIAQQFQIIRFDPNIVRALRDHADGLARIAELLNVNPRQSEDDSNRMEIEIPKHVDQLLHAFRLIREEVLREFQCKPNEVVLEALETAVASHYPAEIAFLKPLSAENPGAIIAAGELRRILGLLIETQLQPGAARIPQGLSFSVRTEGDRWLLEMIDKKAYIEPVRWGAVFARPEGGSAPAGLPEIPPILARYGGDICIKQSIQDVGTTVLLRLKLAT